MPPHISQIYNHHEQAANRESLSALALAISAPRFVKLLEVNFSLTQPVRRVASVGRSVGGKNTLQL